MDILIIFSSSEVVAASSWRPQVAAANSRNRLSSSRHSSSWAAMDAEAALDLNLVEFLIRYLFILGAAIFTTSKSTVTVFLAI